MQLIEHAPELSRYASIWIINPQGSDETARFKNKRGAPFTFLADPELRVIHLYRVYHTLHSEHGHIPYPVTFIVRPDGIIVWRFLGLKPRDRPTVHNILDALRSIDN